MAGVTITNLSKHYGGVGGMPALSTLDLTIGNNQFVTLLGPSGCGKTTTLRLIAGYMAPDGGTIHVDGRLLSSKDRVTPPEQRGMGMVFQNYAVWPHKTVFENVAFGLKLRKVPNADMRSRVDTALALVNLAGYGDRLPSQLSGGQQQRVALARSLVVEPEILLLDEPLSNLDAKLREHMRTELKHLQRRTGITFIYVTHDQAEALALSDKIAVMHAGRLQQFGTPHEVYAHPATRMVADFMGHVNLVPARVLDAADGHGSLSLAGVLTTRARIDLAKPGEEVDVAVRPENILIGKAAGHGATTSQTADAKVTDKTFLGNMNEYLVALASGPVLRVQTHPKQDYAVGDAVSLALEPSELSVFRRDGAEKSVGE
jgi:iron(III) transport system ATP-binding protein